VRERLVERHARLHQRRELARQQRDGRRRQALARRLGAAPSPAVPSTGSSIAVERARLRAAVRTWRGVSASARRGAACARVDRLYRYAPSSAFARDATSSASDVVPSAIQRRVAPQWRHPPASAAARTACSARARGSAGASARRRPAIRRSRSDPVTSAALVAAGRGERLERRREAQPASSSASPRWRAARPTGGHSVRTSRCASTPAGSTPAGTARRPCRRAASRLDASLVCSVRSTGARQRCLDGDLRRLESRIRRS